MLFPSIKNLSSNLSARQDRLMVKLQDCFYLTPQGQEPPLGFFPMVFTPWKIFTVFTTLKFHHPFIRFRKKKSVQTGSLCWEVCSKAVQLFQGCSCRAFFPRFLWDRRVPQKRRWNQGETAEDLHPIDGPLSLGHGLGFSHRNKTTVSATIGKKNIKGSS